MKSQHAQDKENYDASQKELNTEGIGARKRLRLRSGKENIVEATWTDDVMGMPAINEDVLETVATSCIDFGSATAAPHSSHTDVNELQWIPRKRTNTNHVIPPKKPLRQGKLNLQVKTQALVVSPHASLAEGQRGNSVRNNIRKSVAGRISDLPNATIQETLQDKTLEPKVGLSEPVHGTARLLPKVDVRTENDNAEGLLNFKLNKLFELSEATASPPGEAAQIDARQLLKTPDWSIQALPLVDAQEDVVESRRSSIFNGHAGIECVRASPPNEIVTSPGRRSMATPDSVLASIEKDTDAGAVQTSKAVRTPKRKRGFSRRRATRRSLRTTRASSVRADDHAVRIGPGTTSLPICTAGAIQFEPVVVDQNTEKDSARSEAFEATDAADNYQKRQLGKAGTVLSPISPRSGLGELFQDSISHSANDAIASNDLPEGQRYTRCEDAELEDDDISTQLMLQLAADTQHQHISDEDFDLQPPSVSIVTKILDSAPDGADLQSISEVDIGLSSPRQGSFSFSSPTGISLCGKSCRQFALKSKEGTMGVLEHLGSNSVPASSEESTDENETVSLRIEDHIGLSIPESTTSELVDTISENAQPVVYDHDETDMLRSFLTRVQANKAAKATTYIPKRKRSLPHSPLRLPLGESANISPTPQKVQREFDVGPPCPSPSKQHIPSNFVRTNDDDTVTESTPMRRSGRTRLPVIKTLLSAPSHIPVRRLGQDGDTTVTLKRTEEKELAALTRVNTRKNKGGSQSVAEILAKKIEEKEDPTLRQRLIKEVFNETTKKPKKERRKSVVWAKELTQYQTVEGRGLNEGKEAEKIAAPEEKKGAVKVGIRSKISLGMAANGTPAAKRKKVR